jgi:formate dehydrogenase alpha subunit
MGLTQSVSESIEITINGITVATQEGKSILESAREYGVDIPSLCYDKRLKAYGGCRLCLVAIQGVNRPMSACTTPVTDGMEIITENDHLTRLRKTVLSLLLSNHPNDCMLCEKTGDCRLQDLAYRYNVDGKKYTGEKWDLPIKDDNPFIAYDPSKCIVCGRCVNICHDVVMAGTIDMTGRSFFVKPDTAFGKPLTPDICLFCGQCVSTCPVGALVEKQSRGKGRSHEMKKVKTTCTYCGTGCNFFLNVKDGQVIKVTSDYDAPVNQGNLCIKGRFGYEFIHHQDRFTTPLIREGDDFRPASWDEALDLVATRFKELSDKYGPDAVGGFSSSRCTNEENFLFAKWVRTTLGTNNVDNCARV